jgi:hypothetical protein
MSYCACQIGPSGFARRVRKLQAWVGQAEVISALNFERQGCQAKLLVARSVG